MTALPVWWHECEACGKSLPDGVPAVVQMIFGALPNAVYCMECWGDSPIDSPRPVPDGGLLA